jgi:hypothetical protein
MNHEVRDKEQSTQENKKYADIKNKYTGKRERRHINEYTKLKKGQNLYILAY